MLPSVLLVDDEPEILKALQRVLRKHFQVFPFSDPQLAIDYFKENPCQIVISDMKMPSMDGALFLQEITQINPRCKRVALTGYADADLAQRAINEGKVSIYLNKPWDNKDLLDNLFKLIEELKVENRKLTNLKRLKVDHQKLTYHKESLSVTANFMEDEHRNVLKQRDYYKSSHNELLHLSATLISMQTHDNNGHAFRIAKQAKLLALKCSLSKKESINVYLAALYHRVGITTLSQKLIETPWYKLSQQEKYSWSKYPQASAEILLSTTFLSPCAEIVKHLNECIDGSGLPDKLIRNEIPLGSKILAIVIYFDLLISGEITGKTLSPPQAKVIISGLTASMFDITVLNTFFEMLALDNIERGLAVNEVKEGMTLSHDIIDNQGNKLLLEGVELSHNQIERLQDYQSRVESTLIIYVL